MPKPRRMRTKAGTKSLLANSDAKATLQRAAKAAGVSLRDLVHLAVDAGAALSVPKKDSATERYTLEDLGRRMWTLVLTEIGPSERPEWFKGLAKTQQVALIVFLRDQGFSTATIARELDLSVSTVQSTWNRFADELGTQVVNVRLNTIVGDLQLAAERAGEGAMRKEDWSTYWRIQKELIGLLQDLGVVDRAIHRSEVEHVHKVEGEVEHRVKFEQQASAEVDRIVALRLKQQRREEEIKQVDAEVINPALIDEIPHELQPKDHQLSMSMPFVDEEYLEDIEDA